MAARRCLEFIFMRSGLLLIKTAIARYLCHPLVGKVISTVLNDRIPHQGCIISTSGLAVVPSVKAKIFWGLYESAEMRFVTQYLREDLDVIELGSSLGVVSAHIACKIQSSKQLVCVEANRDLLHYIRTNISQNCAKDNVSVIHSAIDDRPNHQPFINLLLAGTNTGSKVSSITTSESVTVPAVTLTEVLLNYDIHDFTLVSDIEGGEIGFIEGDQNALTGCQQLIIELHEGTWDGRRCTVQDHCEHLQERHGFFLRDRRGPVCVFERLPT